MAGKFKKTSNTKTLKKCYLEKNKTYAVDGSETDLQNFETKKSYQAKNSCLEIIHQEMPFCRSYASKEERKNLKAIFRSFEITQRGLPGISRFCNTIHASSCQQIARQNLASSAYSGNPNLQRIKASDSQS